MKAVTISARILLMIAVSVGALLIVGVVGLYVARTGTQSIEEINDGALARIQTLGASRQAFMDARVGMFALFLNSNDEEMVALEKQIGDKGVEIAKEAIDGTLPADMSKVTYTEPAVITKENVDQYYKADAVF